MKNSGAKVAVLAVAWSQVYVDQAVESIKQWREKLGDDFDYFLISDRPVMESDGFETIIAKFQLVGSSRKAEGIRQYLPSGYSEFLYLDTDIRIVGSIEFGFVQAKNHGIAVALASTYVLDEFQGFEQILLAEGEKLGGQPQYNAGVIFFCTRDEAVRDVLDAWFDLCLRYQGKWNRDQHFLALAMLLQKFNPYVLTKAFNTRGVYEPVLGQTRIWHSNSPVPVNLNVEYSARIPRLLSKGKLRPLRRWEIQRKWLKPTITEKILNPVYRALVPKRYWLGRPGRGERQTAEEQLRQATSEKN